VEEEEEVVEWRAEEVVVETCRVVEEEEEVVEAVVVELEVVESRRVEEVDVEAL
jgi:hypothetical protein